MEQSHLVKPLAIPCALIAVLASRSCGAPIEGAWSAGLDRYDYLERIELGRGKGELVWGWDQSIRYEGTFDYEASDDRITLRYHDPIGTKTLSFATASGDYRFEQDTPVGRIEIRCAKRVVFGACPFPDGLGSANAYYADCFTRRISSR